MIRSVSRNAEQPPSRGRLRSQNRPGLDEDSGEPTPARSTKEPKEPRFSELRATLNHYRSGAPLLKYWWVVAIGAVVAVSVGMLALQAKREPYQYTAAAQMLVTSQEAPYFRYSITREGTRSFGNDQPSEVVVDTGPPDTDTLVQAANLYPLLIQSDLVAMERIERFGATPGEVEARAVFAVQTPNRFDASSVPVIEVNATATDPEDAVKLADDTVAAFVAWIQTQQESAQVKEDQRILLERISAARVVTETGGPSYAIPILLAAAVFFAFCGLAFLLDSLARRGRALLDETGGEAPAPIPLSNAAATDHEAVRSREVEGSA